MFNTFAVVEPWNNGGSPDFPRPIIPGGESGGPEDMVYDNLTLEDMLNVLVAGKASPGLVKALNRVSDGIHVPRDFKTLEKAVEWFEQYEELVEIYFTIIKDDATHEQNDATAEHKEQETAAFTRITIPRKIVLAKGVHGSLKGPLHISSELTIVGDPGVGRKDVVVLSGIVVKSFHEEDCHLEHLTIRQGRVHGVVGESSFTMEDVLVEQCRFYGVIVSGTSTHCKCHNVVVTDCGRGGVYATDGATITLSGLENQMLVHHNCKTGGAENYGLGVGGEYGATIQVVLPLTIQTVSKDNINVQDGYRNGLIMNFSPDALDLEAADRIIELTVDQVSEDTPKNK
jgi:hypothetical protein